MADAALVLRTRTAVHGGVAEMVVWRVPAAVPASSHLFKYRLVFVRNGERVVGYDNERGKGDHKHLRGEQSNYLFSDVQTLMNDFMADVEANR